MPPVLKIGEKNKKKLGVFNKTPFKYILFYALFTTTTFVITLPLYSA